MVFADAANRATERAAMAARTGISSFGLWSSASPAVFGNDERGRAGVHDAGDGIVLALLAGTSETQPRVDRDIFQDSKYPLRVHSLLTNMGNLLSKPKPSQGLVVTGILLQFLGTVIFSIALPASFNRYSGGQAIFWVFFGAILLLIGLIILLKGIARATAGIDYLVSIASTVVTPVSAPKPTDIIRQEEQAVADS